jgi:hypothetical protein
MQAYRNDTFYLVHQNCHLIYKSLFVGFFVGFICPIFLLFFSSEYNYPSWLKIKFFQFI